MTWGVDQNHQVSLHKSTLTFCKLFLSMLLWPRRKDKWWQKMDVRMFDSNLFLIKGFEMDAVRLWALTLPVVYNNWLIAYIIDYNIKTFFFRFSVILIILIFVLLSFMIMPEPVLQRCSTEVTISDSCCHIPFSSCAETDYSCVILIFV